MGRLAERDALALLAIDQLGIRERSVDSVRRVFWMTAILCLGLSSTGVGYTVFVELHWFPAEAHPVLNFLVAGPLVGGAGVAVLAVRRLPDDRLLRAYPIVALAMIFIAPILATAALFALGAAWAGSVALLFDMIVVIGFYVLRRAAGVLLLAWVALCYGVGLAAIHGGRDAAQEWSFLVACVSMTGLLIGGAMGELDDARGELAHLNENLERRVADQLDEIRQSRARIVEASDAGRRRIERNIHDGAQQQLVAISLDLRMLAEDAERLAPQELRGRLNEAHNDLRAALDDLRELARGLHPAVLTTDGLEAALGQLAARSPIPVSLVAPVTRFPEAVELAAYFVVAEAVANVAKYADASMAEIRVAHADGTLRIAVSDDGRGGASVRDGGGLSGLADRLAAVGGDLRIDSPHGGGTRVHAWLPLRGSGNDAVSD